MSLQNKWALSRQSQAKTFWMWEITGKISVQSREIVSPQPDQNRGSDDK